MLFNILYHPDIARVDIPQLNANIRTRVRKAIEERLAVDPVHFGHPLRRSLKGYRKLRVGDYRVIYEIRGNDVRIYTIGHRKEVYELNPREWD